VEINLVMSDRSLLGLDEEPGEVEGYGPIPAEIARSLALDGEAKAWLRRLYTAPGSGQLIAMESHRRLFQRGQARFSRVRDRRCRTPYCGAPIRQIDHVKPSGNGGATRVDNAQGYCQACNLAKQAPGWITTVTNKGLSGAHEVLITTPTGHQYRSRAPDPPGQAA
jgi:hypothetical protein